MIFLSKLFLIVEISVNYCGSFKKAKKIIRYSKKKVAGVVKIKTYTADSMTIKSTKKYFKINERLWNKKMLLDLYNEAKTTVNWYKELSSYAKKLNILNFGFPFYESADDILEKLKCPIYKMASSEMADIPLIKK